MARLLLASKSPRRRQLLAELGYPVGIVDVDVDEHSLPTLPASAVAEYLARRKAAAFPAAQLTEGDILVAADTTVVLGSTVLGKPASHDEAVQMLQSLAGRAHKVYTGVCLRSIGQETSFSEETTVHFAPLSDEEILYYIDRYRPYDKAGAYGIQEWIGMAGIERIEGCYYNVMGLPVARLYSELKKMLQTA